MKLGIIGLGLRMKGLLSFIQKENPAVKVVGVIDPRPEPLADLREEDRAGARVFASIEEMVREAKPDGLMIGTRCNLHTPLAIEAAKYDIPLFLEKPVATSMEQAMALEAAFEKARCPVIVSFPLRVSTLCERVKGLLDHGATGRVEHVEATNYVPYGNVYFDSWYRDYSITQGLFLQKATHDFDYLIYLVGAPITRVAAMSSQGRVFRDTKTLRGAPDPYSNYLENIGTPEEGMNEDSSSALLEFANGARGVYTQVFFSKRLGKRGATISGYNGTVDFDWYKGSITCTHHHSPFTDTIAAAGDEAHFGGDFVLVRDFLAMLRDRTAPSRTPIRTGLESVYACLAAKESAETGRFVNVRQVGQCS